MFYSYFNLSIKPAYAGVWRVSFSLRPLRPHPSSPLSSHASYVEEILSVCTEENRKLDWFLFLAARTAPKEPPQTSRNIGRTLVHLVSQAVAESKQGFEAECEGVQRGAVLGSQCATDVLLTL